MRRRKGKIQEGMIVRCPRLRRFLLYTTGTTVMLWLTCCTGSSTKYFRSRSVLSPEKLISLSFAMHHICLERVQDIESFHSFRRFEARSVFFTLKSIQKLISSLKRFRIFKYYVNHNRIFPYTFVEYIRQDRILGS